MAGGNAGAIGFYLQVEDNISPVLDRVERGYNRLTRTLDDLNRVAQRKASNTMASLERLTQTMESLPGRMTNAASRLSRAMGAVTRNIGGGGGRNGGGGGNPRAIEEVVTRAINRAMSKMSMRLQASVPRVKNDKVFHTRNLRNIYRQTPQPPDYTGNFEGFQHGGLVGNTLRGSRPVDNVPALLGKGELVIPSDMTSAFAKLLGKHGKASRFAGGGVPNPAASALDLARSLEDATELVTMSGQLLYSVIKGNVSDIRQFVIPILPWEKWSKAWKVSQQPSGGMLSTGILQDVSASYTGSIKTLADAVLGMRGISSALQTFTTVVGGFGKIFSTIGGYINAAKSRLGIDPDSGLTIGAFKALAIASAGYAAYMEKDWMKIRLAMTQAGGAFDEIKKASITAAISYGMSTDSMIALTSKLTDEQKLSGKTFSDTMEIITKFSIGNEELAAQVADMTVDFREFSMSIDKQKGVLSAYIVIGQETRATLEELAQGTKLAHTAFTQIALSGGDVSKSMAQVGAVSGVMKNYNLDGAKAFEILNAAVDPTRWGDAAGMYAYMAQATGESIGGLRDLAKSDTATFASMLFQTLGNIDVSKMGEMEAALAQMGATGIDKNMLETLRLVQTSGRMGQFASDLQNTSAMAVEAAKSGKALQDRWNQYTSVMSEAWNKVKNSFTAILMLIGEPILAMIKPFVMAFTWALQGIAYAMLAIGKPIQWMLAGLATLSFAFGWITPIISMIGALKLLSASWGMLGPIIAGGTGYIGKAIIGTAGAVDGFTSTVISAVSRVVPEVAAPLGRLQTGVSGLTGSMRTNTKAVTSWFGRLAVNPIGALWEAVTTLTKATLKNAWASVVFAAKWVWTNVVLQGVTYTIKGLSLALKLLRTAIFWEIALALAAIAIVYTALSKNTGVSDFFYNISEWLGGISKWARGYGDFGAAVADFIDVIQYGFKWVSMFFAKVWEYSDIFWAGLKPFIESAKTAFSAAFYYITSSLKGFIGTSADGTLQLSKDWEWVKDLLWGMSVVIGAVLKFAAYAIAGVLIIGTYVVKTLWNVFVDPWLTIWQGIKDIWNGSIIGGLYKIIKGAFWGAISLMWSPFSIAFAIIKDIVCGAWNYLFGNTIFSPETIGEVFWGIVDVLKAIGRSIWDSITSPFCAAWNFIKGLFSEGGILAGFGSSIMNFGAEIFGNMLAGLAKFVSNALFLVADGLWTLGAKDTSRSVESLAIKVAQMGTGVGAGGGGAPAGGGGGAAPAGGGAKPAVDLTNTEGLLTEVRDLLAMIVRGSKTGSMDPLALALIQQQRIG